MSNDNNDESDNSTAGREQLGAWGVPESVEDDIDPNAGYPSILGIPGVASGNTQESGTDSRSHHDDDTTVQVP